VQSYGLRHKKCFSKWPSLQESLIVKLKTETCLCEHWLFLLQGNKKYFLIISPFFYSGTFNTFERYFSWCSWL